MGRKRGAMIAVALSSLLIPGLARAQGVTLGGKLGVNFARAAITEQGGEQTRRGAVLGGVLGIPVHEAFAIHLEALYAQKGVVAEDGDERAVLKVNYLELPVLARVQIPTRGSVLRPVFYAGPAVSFEVACSVRFEEGGISAEVGCRDELAGIDELNTASVDFGLTGGAGVDIDLGRTILSLEGRYTHGFVDILEEDATQIKNRVVSMTVGVSFRVP